MLSHFIFVLSDWRSRVSIATSDLPLILLLLGTALVFLALVITLGLAVSDERIEPELTYRFRDFYEKGRCP